MIAKHQLASGIIGAIADFAAAQHGHDHHCHTADFEACAATPQQQSDYLGTA